MSPPPQGFSHASFSSNTMVFRPAARQPLGREGSGGAAAQNSDGLHCFGLDGRVSGIWEGVAGMDG